MRHGDDAGGECYGAALRGNGREIIRGGGCGDWKRKGADIVHKNNDHVGVSERRAYVGAHDSAGEAVDAGAEG